MQHGDLVKVRREVPMRGGAIGTIERFIYKPGPAFKTRDYGVRMSWGALLAFDADDLERFYTKS